MGQFVCNTLIDGGHVITVVLVGLLVGVVAAGWAATREIRSAMYRLVRSQDKE